MPTCSVGRPGGICPVILNTQSVLSWERGIRGQGDSWEKGKISQKVVLHLNQHVLLIQMVIDIDSNLVGYDMYKEGTNNLCIFNMKPAGCYK